MVTFGASFPLDIEPLPKPDKPNYILFTMPGAGISWSTTWEGGKDSKVGVSKVRQQYEVEKDKKLYLPKGG